MNYNTYSIHNQYNLHNFNSNFNNYVKTPNFKASLDTPNDSVELSNKKGMSNTTKFGLGAIAVAGLTTLAYFLSRGKIGEKQTKQLSEHIDFSPAKTIEEAKKFAQDKLKINYSDYENANVDMLNTINEMLLKNTNKDKVFDIIHFEKKGVDNIENCMSFSHICNNKINTRVLRINTDYINKFDNFIDYVFKYHNGINISKIISKDKSGIYNITKQEYYSEPLKKLIDKLNNYNNKSTYKDKLEIYDGFSELCANYNNILKGNNTMRDFSFDGSFIHEIGHSIHYNNNREIFNTLADNKNELVKEFRNNENFQKIAQQVSNYAKTEPLEFVAEVYKGVKKGKKFDDDVMALYKKYGGPTL